MKLGKFVFLEKRIIGKDRPDQGPLLIRWVLFRATSFGIYLHKLCRSDYDRALHDHPWPFISIILKGGYWERHSQTKDGHEKQEWRKPGSVLLRPAEWRHRIVINDGPAWSLILVGRRQRRWGFFLKEGWCWWRKHNYDLGICEDGILWENGKD